MCRRLFKSWFDIMMGGGDAILIPQQEKTKDSL
jgi:hypothetical protein